MVTSTIGEDSVSLLKCAAGRGGLYLPTLIFRSLSVSHQLFHSLFRMVFFIFKRARAPGLLQLIPFFLKRAAITLFMLDSITPALSIFLSFSLK